MNLQNPEDGYGSWPWNEMKWLRHLIHEAEQRAKEFEYKAKVLEVALASLMQNKREEPNEHQNLRAPA